MTMLTHGKTIVAFLVAVLAAAWPQITGDYHVDAAEGIAIATAVVTAAATYLVPLAPGMPGIKTATYVVLTGLGTAATVAVGGFSADDLLLILGAAATAAGVWIAPAASTTGVSVGWGSDQYDLAA
jgi:hypothetical protein